MKTLKSAKFRSFDLRHYFRLTIPILIASQSLTALQADPATSVATISVNASKIEGPVNRYVLGQSMEAGDAAGVFRGSTTSAIDLETGNGFWDPDLKRPDPAIVEKCHEIGVGMLRYPGGSLADNYDWRKAVGPLATRGDWKCGLEEYLAVCHAIGAEPLITASDYILPADQMPANNSQLVEYLNAPATPEHPWAEKRKEWGHPQPFGVKWFELGNESDNGNCDLKPHRQFTPEQYAKYAIDCARAMKAIDPTIKVGIVTAVTSSDPRSNWNLKVLHLAGSIADFVVVHEYAPSMGPNMDLSQESQLMQACMAEGDQYEKSLKDYEQAVRDEVGHDLPLAITEYNAGFILEKPKPYRFSYGASLECADLVRIFLKPENEVVAANYWQLLNGYWGMLTRPLEVPDGKITERAAFPLYRLWGEHFGPDLVAATVHGPSEPFQGFSSVLPASGTTYHSAAPAGFAAISQNQDKAALSGNGFTVQWTGPDSLKVNFDNFAGEFYPTFGQLEPIAGKKIEDCDYQLNFEGRYTPTATPGTEVVPLGLELSDSRGWDKTGSVVQVKTIQEPQWHPFSSDFFHTLPGAPGVTFNGILATGVHKISGVLEIRHLKVEALSKTTFPEYALLTASASLSQQKDKLYLMVFNKSADKDLPAQINLQGFPASSAKLWQVNGPSLAALDHVSEVVSGDNLKVDGNGLSYSFPAHSMTAIEISK